MTFYAFCDKIPKERQGEKMYNEFARYYDLLMEDAQYDKRTEYLLSLFDKFDRKPTLLLDLCCGTGEFSFRLAKNGISVVGVDISPDMLSVAMAKKCDEDVMFLCQNAAQLDLYGTVDGAVCCLDSLNHITDYEDFKAAIAKTALFLEKDRLFIFDVNTVFKHKFVLADNIFEKDGENVRCVWQNERNGNLVDITLQFEDSCGNILGCEKFSERAYTDMEIETALNEAGLETISVFGELKFDIPDEKCERKVFVTRKI